MTEIRRPPVIYDDKKHTYHLEGVKLDGVSTISKVGDDEVWGVASAWAFRIGYEGAVEVYNDTGEWFPWKPDEMREKLKQLRKTPWHKTTESQDRGTNIHDALEHLAQHSEVPILDQYPEEQRGYIQALCRWYIDYRPSFEATEVQVVSTKHKFAGRYDLRAIITERNPEGDEPRLVLIDLKTSKRVYPTTQFAQLAGYELASVEMGFPRTDAQYVLNCKADGDYLFERSCATADDFLAYLAAHRAIQRIKQEVKKRK
jgi:hypothetical protein